MKYTARAFGWLIVIEAPNARRALSLARQAAPGASLLSTDVTGVKPASSTDIAWYESQTGDTNVSRKAPTERPKAKKGQGSA